MDRVNSVARAINERVTPPAVLFGFAEQGVRYGKVHAHAILIRSNSCDDFTVQDIMDLQSFLNAQFGRSEVVFSRQACVKYLTKYATKECYNDQWG